MSLHQRLFTLPTVRKHTQKLYSQQSKGAWFRDTAYSYLAIHRVPTPPAEPPTLGQAVTWSAQLDGCVWRRRSDRPGAEVMWRVPLTVS